MKLGEIQSKIEALAKVIEAPAHNLPKYGYVGEGAYLETEGNFLHLVIVERGEELERFTHLDTDEVLFHVFSKITFSMASDYECRHRVRGVDFRRLLFKKQLELLGMLNPEWKKREFERQQALLRQYPFEDN